MADPRIEAMARILVRYSTDLKPGEIVQIAGDPVAKPLLLACYREALRAGAHPIMLVQFEEALRTLFEEGTAEEIAYVNPIARYAVEQAQAMIRVDAPS